MPFPPDPAISPRFAQIASFMRLPVAADPSGADVAILGVPYDGGATYRPGARFAPREIRSQSSLVRGATEHLGTDLFGSLAIVDAGDVDVSPFDLSAALDTIQGAVERLTAANVRPVLVGGDHSITLASLRALHRKYGRLAVVQFDAHSDTYGPAYGTHLHHGSTFRNAIEEGLVDSTQFVQVGIRGQLVRITDLAYARERGVRILTTDDVYTGGLHTASALTARFGNTPTYVSVDIDVVDPAFAPGTGTPVPGGLSSYQILAMIRTLQHLHVVGCDLVEVSPAYDHAGITSLLAASLLYELICLFHSG